jgi:hypothetical protein
MHAYAKRQHEVSRPHRVSYYKLTPTNLYCVLFRTSFQTYFINSECHYSHCPSYLLSDSLWRTACLLQDVGYGKSIPVHATRFYWKNGGTVPLILNLDNRWNSVVWFTAGKSGATGRLGPRDDREVTSWQKKIHNLSSICIWRWLDHGLLNWQII